MSFSMKIGCAWLALSIICGSSAGARAEESAVHRLEPMEVTEQFVEHFTLTPGLVVIPRSELEAHPERTAWEAVAREVPGVFFTHRNPVGYGIGPGSGGGVNIRGSSGGQRYIVLIDGRPDTMGLFGHPLNDAYFIHNLERIEMIKGPASLRYGNSAMAGSMNLITRRATEPFEGRAGVEYGQWDTMRGFIGTGGSQGGFDWYVTGFGARSDGHRDNSAGENHGGSVHLGTTLSERWYLESNLRHSYTRVEDPGTLEEVDFVRSRGEKLSKYSKLARSGVDVTLHNSSDHTSGFIKAYLNYGDHTIRNGLEAPRMGTTVANRYWYDSTDSTIGLWIEQTFRLSGQGRSITLGGDVREYSGDPKITTPPPSIPAWEARDLEKQRQLEAATYLLGEQALFDDKVFLSGGLRVQHQEVFGEELIPAAGLRVLPVEGTVLRASVAKGYRAPTLAEQYIVPVANKDLKAERMLNYEIGWEQALGSRILFDVSAFYQDFENLIVSESISGDGRPPFQLRNSGKYVAKGFEFLTRITPVQPLHLTASFAYIDPGDRTAGTPLYQYKVDSRYTWEKLDVGASIQVVQQFYASDLKQNRIGDFTVVDARAQYRFTDAFSVYVRGDNLLDEKYETILGKPMPGRAFYAGIEFRF